MGKKNRPPRQQTAEESDELQQRLLEAEETLHAIRQYMVDAFVIGQPENPRIVTLKEADYPYRVMVESMNEGAVTLTPDGIIFYCNPRLAEMVGSTQDDLVATHFQDLIIGEQREAFENILKQAEQRGMRAHFFLRGAGGKNVPVQLSLHKLGQDVNGVFVIATDVSERINSEKKIRSLASQLTTAEQKERHRISQILHDDLQQRLFAIKAQMFLIQKGLKTDADLSTIKEDVEDVQARLSDAISLTRNLSIDISPVVLNGDGLAEAITWLSSRMKEQYNLHITLNIKEDAVNFEEHMRVLLFQAVRELLFNIVKHADTLEAVVIMEKVGDHAHIEVRDVGKGFNVDQVMNDPRSSHGLRTLRDRLSLMGCAMETVSAPGTGTRVSIDIPLEIQAV